MARDVNIDDDMTIDKLGNALLHGRKVVILSNPRRIAGGSVVTITWAMDNNSMRLSDGTVHPAHRAGFQWEEPICNLVIIQELECNCDIAGPVQCDMHGPRE